MKSKLSTILLGISVLISTMSMAQHQKKQKTAPTPFFSTEDASNWEYIIKNKDLRLTDVFKMENGILQITGASSGYLRTKKVLSNYMLQLEWRWTKSLGNSGVLVHIQHKDSIWPVCYQVQQKADAAGDIICMNGLWAKECTDKVKFTVAKQQASNEKALGEWNTMKVICRDNNLVVFINDLIQNNISGLTVDKGFIGFQCEGMPMEFRNLSISKLKPTKK